MVQVQRSLFSVFNFSTLTHSLFAALAIGALSLSTAWGQAAPAAGAGSAYTQPVDPRTAAFNALLERCKATNEPSEKQKCEQDIAEANDSLLFSNRSTAAAQAKQQLETQCLNLTRDVREHEVKFKAGCSIFAGTPDLATCVNLENTCTIELQKDLEEADKCEIAMDKKCQAHPDFANSRDYKTEIRDAKKSLDEAQKEILEIEKSRMESSNETQRRTKEATDARKDLIKDYEERRAALKKQADERLEQLGRDQDKQVQEASNIIQKMDSELMQREVALKDFDRKIATANTNRELRCREYATAHKAKFIVAKTNERQGVRRATGQFAIASQSTALTTLIERHGELERKLELEKCLIGENQAGIDARAKMNELIADRETASEQIVLMRSERAKLQQKILADLRKMESEVTTAKAKVGQQLLEEQERLDKNHLAELQKVDEERRMAQTQEMQKSALIGQQTAQFSRSMQDAQTELMAANQAKKCGGKLALKGETQQASDIEKVAAGFSARESLVNTCESLNALFYSAGTSRPSTCSLPAVCAFESDDNKPKKALNKLKNREPAKARQ